jgi:uncharacterized protein
MKGSRMCRRHRSPGVYVEETSGSPPVISAVPTSIAAFVGRTAEGPFDEPVEIRSWNDHERTFGPATGEGPLGRVVRSFFDNGGGTAVVVRRRPPGDDGSGAEAVGSAPLATPEDYLGRQLDGTGIYALERGADFNLLCIPPDAADSDVPGLVYTAAAQLCVERGAFLLVDSPTVWSTKWREGRVADISMGDLGTSFSVEQARSTAVYFPRLRIVDPADGIEHVVPPCGAVAGVFASTDEARGVWKTPAGVGAAIAGIAGLEVDVDDAGQSELNPRGINCLRSLPAHGVVVWGGRTMRAGVPGDEFRYVAVRRLALHIEESIRRGTGWVVHQPNGPALWTSVRTAVEVFLSGLFRRGAFAGSTPRDAYFVKCSRDTMTQADIDAGRVRMMIGIAPLRPAEFVILRLELRSS